MARYTASGPVFVNNSYVEAGAEFEVADDTPVGKTWSPVDAAAEKAVKSKGKGKATKAEPEPAADDPPPAADELA